MNKAQQPTISPKLFRTARALLDLTRKECAEVIGISPETVKNIEHGVFIPTVSTIDKILKGFASRGVKFSTQQVIAFEDTTIHFQLDYAEPLESEAATLSENVQQQSSEDQAEAAMVATDILN